MAQSVVEIIIRAVDQTKRGLTQSIGGLGDLKKAYQNLTPALNAFGIAAAGAMALATKGAINAADEMGKAAQSAGTTTESLSTLAHAAELSGVSLESLVSNMARLSVSALNAAKGSKEQADAFKAVGVQVTDVNGKLRPTEELLLDVSQRFSTMRDSSEKTAMAVKLFGRAGAELIPFLNQGKAGIQAMQEEARKLGLEIGGNTAARAEQFNDNLTRLQAASKGVFLELAAAVLPTLVKFTDLMVESSKEGGKLGIVLNGLKEFLKGFANGVITLAVTIGAMFDVTATALAAIGASIVALFTDGADSAKAIWAEAFEDIKRTGEDALNTLNEAFAPSEGERPTPPGVPTEADVVTAEDRFKAIQEAAKSNLNLMTQEARDFFGAWVQLQNEARVGTLAFLQTVSTAFKDAFAKNLSAVVLQAKTAEEAVRAVGDALVQAVVDFIAQKVAAFVTEKALAAAATALLGAQAVAAGLTASAVAGAWATPAALVSLATLGANAGPAIAAMSSTIATANALALPKFETGVDFFPETGPAVLHMGERVVQAEANEDLTDFLASQSQAPRSGSVTLMVGARELAQIIWDLSLNGTLKVHPQAVRK